MKSLKKKTHSKLAKRNNQIEFVFPYCLELPKRPKQKISCYKMWLIEQLYIKLGLESIPSGNWP